jgi:hypothetical protein
LRGTPDQDTQMRRRDRKPVIVTSLAVVLAESQCPLVDSKYVRCGARSPQERGCEAEKRDPMSPEQFEKSLSGGRLC